MSVSTLAKAAASAIADSSYSQQNRPLRVSTPLGPNVLLLTGFTGRENISHLYTFHLDLLATNGTDIPFDKLLGKKIVTTIRTQMAGERFFSGICNRVSEGVRDSHFTHYRMEVVPQFWLLTRRIQSRIFQHETIPDILKKVLKGLDVEWQLQGDFDARDYLIQYRESDFAFASRLMEEEGIFYFFKHSADGHKLVVANNVGAHPDVPVTAEVPFDTKKNESGTNLDVHVWHWEKTQEIRSGKYEVWDYCFEMPDKHLEADSEIQSTVEVGTVEHNLQVANNNPDLEIYDWPGVYAQRYDGIDRGGGDQSGDLGKIFKDNERTATIRMEEEAVHSILINGVSNARQLTSGHKFTLNKHFNADGEYVLIGVDHRAHLGFDYRSSGSSDFIYENTFTAIPVGLPFRPRQITPKPVIQGPQTAKVVGPPGEIIYPDKYGRVKIQFFWDRQGKFDLDSSCWVRVSQNWAGGTWGGMFVPHVGHEVVVEFEEGDIDRPLITGRVYNADNMPKRPLPDHKTQSVISDHGGDYVIMEGKAGTQNIDLYSPIGDTQILYGAAPGAYNHHAPSALNGFTQPGWGSAGSASAGINITTGLDFNEWIGGHRHVGVGGDDALYVGGPQNEWVVGPYHGEMNSTYLKKVTGNYELDILTGTYTLNVNTGTYTRNTKSDDTVHVISGNSAHTVDSGTYTRTVKGTDTKHVTSGDYNVNVDSGNITIHCKGNYSAKGDADKKEFWSGSSASGILGNKFSIVVGGNESIVIGGNTGTNIIFNMPITLGLKFEYILGAEVKIITGAKVENVPAKYELRGLTITNTVTKNSFSATDLKVAVMSRISGALHAVGTALNVIPGP
jgi:type VI secretion system secreted protein VgrG